MNDQNFLQRLVQLDLFGQGFMQISEVAKNLNLLGMSILNLAIGQLLHRVKTNDIKTNLVLGMVKNSSTKGLLVDKT